MLGDCNVLGMMIKCFQEAKFISSEQEIMQISVLTMNWDLLKIRPLAGT